MEPPAPPGLVVLGGRSDEGPLASVETFGFENCTIPPLPETRYHFGSFITPSEPQQLAVCGGWWMGKPNSTDCVTLNVTSGQWERGRFENSLLGDGVHGVINMEEHGVFIVHKRFVSILEPHTESWVAGPVFPIAAECGCNISSSSFVTIHMNDTNNLREYGVSNGVAELQVAKSWPDLETKRRGPGCGATAYHLIVAGGVSDRDVVLRDVEVFLIANKARMRGGPLRQARAFFQIIPVGTVHSRLLAVGGQGETSSVDTTEWWDERGNFWMNGPVLDVGRTNFAALMAPPHLVRSEMGVSAHSCPLQMANESCVFPSKEPNLQTATNQIHGAQVCLSQGDNFTCPTMDNSTGPACDTARCPLEGSPLAPTKETQPTGASYLAYNDMCPICKHVWVLKSERSKKYYFTIE